MEKTHLACFLVACTSFVALNAQAKRPELSAVTTALQANFNQASKIFSDAMRGDYKCREVNLDGSSGSTRIYSLNPEMGLWKIARYDGEDLVFLAQTDLGLVGEIHHGTVQLLGRIYQGNELMFEVSETNSGDAKDEFACTPSTLSPNYHLEGYLFCSKLTAEENPKLLEESLKLLEN